MNKLCKTVFKAFIFAVIGTQLAVFLMDKFSLKMFFGKATTLIIYTAIVIAVFAIDELLDKKPAFPSRKLRRIVKEEKYSPAFYRTIQLWVEKCKKKGYVNVPTMNFCEFLIDGGYYNECFDLLSEIDFKSLKRSERQMYFNICLYTAVLLGERELADSIYKVGRPYLVSVMPKWLSPSVKHTLGCYEYMCGNLRRAEELFLQAMEGIYRYEFLCEDFLGLSLCYLETGRLSQAKKAVEEASYWGKGTHHLELKVQRAKKLVEDAFAEKISQNAQS
jgi:hypothetical protein